MFMIQAEALLHNGNGEARDRGCTIFIEVSWQVKRNRELFRKFFRSYALFVNIVANPYTARRSPNCEMSTNDQSLPSL
jgi:hypothetical protein